MSLPKSFHESMVKWYCADIPILYDALKSMPNERARIQGIIDRNKSKLVLCLDSLEKLDKT